METNLAKTSRGTWLYAAALGGLLVAYLLGIHLPNRRAMAHMRTDLALKRQTVQLASLADEIARKQQEIDTANAYLHQLRSQWSRADAGKIFGDISAIARQSGVRMRRFDPSSTIEHHEILQLPLAIECDGSFDQVLEMLRKLERLSQLVWVSALQLQSVPSQQGDLQCKINLEVFADKSGISD